MALTFLGSTWTPFCLTMNLKKLMLDASAGGNIKWKTSEEAYELVENMTASDNDTYNERTHLQKKGVLELQSQDALLAQNKIMTQ